MISFPTAPSLELNDEELKKLREWIYDLESFGHRGSATTQERQAIEYLAAQLEGMELAGVQERFKSLGSYGARVVIHLVIAGLGLGVILWAPFISALVGFSALASLLAEGSTRFKIFSRLLPSRPSNNLSAMIPCLSQQPKKRIILCAHVDTQRTGWIWSPFMMRLFSFFQARAPGPLKSPLAAVDAAMLAHIGLAITMGFGIPIPGYALAIVAVVYAATIVLAAEWSLGKYVPGACDNASGVAAVLTLARRWMNHPTDDVELQILFTGSEEAGFLGSSAWLNRHGAQLRDIPTWFLNLDTLGYGRPRIVESECSLAGITMRYPMPLLHLCQKTAHTLGLMDEGPFPIPTQTDGFSFLARGFWGATVLTFEDGFIIPNYHRPTDLLSNLHLDITALATAFSWHILLAMSRT